MKAIGYVRVCTVKQADFGSEKKAAMKGGK
jgi:hypothetical protein